jgi:hypothetical protein
MKIRAIAGWASVAMLCMFAGACNRSTIDPNLPAITTQPVNATAKAGSTATFTVVATGQAPLSYQWFVFAKAIAGATSPTYTTGTLAASDNNSFYFVLVTNSIGSIESNEVLLTVTTTAPPPGVTANTLGNANPSDVLTLHNDPARTGQNLGETLLTPTNVNASRFGKLGTLITDGQVDAQPLYASGVTLPSGDIRNILYAATEHGSVYAFDAMSGSVIWRTGLAGANEQAADSGACTSGPQERGVTATPVIDRTRGPHGAIYVIANTKDSAGTPIQRIHALDLATGTELFSGPTFIQASASSANSVRSSAQQNFDAAQYQTLSGLQLVNGKLYAAFGPTCGSAADSAWVMSFDAASLNPSGSLYFAPAAGPNVPGFAVSGLSADSAGNLYVFGPQSFISRAVGTTAAVAIGSAGNAFLKLSTENGIALTDTTKTAASNSASSIGPNASAFGGATVLPDLTDEAGKVWHLALGPGSDGNIYVLNRDALGGSALLSMPILQAVEGSASPTGDTPTIAYYGGSVYYAASGNTIKTFSVSDARLSTSPVNQSGNSLGATGAQISISANGAAGGILWAVEDAASGILHAYDAANLSQELYNSTQAANSRDSFNATVSAVSPTIAGGRVYVATKSGIAVFGRLK